MSDPSARRSLRRLSSSNPLELPRAEAPLVAPLPLSKGLGPQRDWAAGGGASEIRIPRWGSNWCIGDPDPAVGVPLVVVPTPRPHLLSNRCIEDPDPVVGVPASSLANCHAVVVKGQQCGQDRRAQVWVVAECSDVLGEYQGLRDKSFPSNPSHQDCQLIPGQISARPTLDPADVVRAGEPVAQARSPLQRHDPSL
jgi:hypothetical protein